MFLVPYGCLLVYVCAWQLYILVIECNVYCNALIDHNMSSEWGMKGMQYTAYCGASIDHIVNSELGSVIACGIDCICTVYTCLYGYV